jgi:glycerophosphoryl diester phosphodiesterase
MRLLKGSHWSRLAAVLGTGVAALGIAALIAALLTGHRATAHAIPETGLTGPSPSRIARPFPWRQPLVIAHRGASDARPENTIGAYRLAIEQGADYVEGDLMVTKDGSLVVRHDRELSATTDVASHPEFATRRVTKQVDGTKVTNWFVEDFTLAELKTLHAVARKGQAGKTPPSASVPPASPAPSTGPATGPETIPTVDEMIKLAQDEGKLRNRAVGLCLELKSPAYFVSLGKSPTALLAVALQRAGLGESGSPVIVESFDADALRTIRKLVPVPLMQLLSGFASPTDPGLSATALTAVASYASSIGVPRELLETGSPGKPNQQLIDTAHQVGLEIDTYTFTATAQTPDVMQLYQDYYAAGIDGVFTDNPDYALAARSKS